ncbi:hypothetical protein SERLADRAFT_374823 [Serpula lacrymans var. lacrymans S7.9]|uniref:Uncharacterized protein n=1 Tax=Serpula lacrymans var. lacrymans (strain S7.9) TaxID=578457 RepID=F8PD11_SERL9|nr:uncharacterized protein SERLADRAFT_374823 [Serpula lacrymans var. lacrymans S7.9]EGO19110.1 hypothetical protein SERLADRAFT_374823 [Serpula lacrymans var. lacrymans S7.9]
MNSLDVTEYKSLEQRLHHEILAFLKYVNPIPEEKAARQQVYELVCKVLNQRFQECQIHLCGSVAQELPLLDRPSGLEEMHI